jgi:hypothetical protein
MLPAIEKLVKNLKPKYDDDVIDRLNYAYTSAFFVLLILVIGTKQYVGEPLQCWMSPEFKGSWEKYIENYCFVENTYYVSFDDDRLPQENQREDVELLYYQWVPVLLIVQLLLFLTPKTFWGAVSWKTGLSVKALIGNLSHADRQKKILTSKKNDEHSEARTIARQMREVIKFNSRRQDKFLYIFPTGSRNNYFTFVYLFYKLLNVLNTGFQLWMMNKFLNTNYWFWGAGVLEDLLMGRDWKSSGTFPRVTYCDFMRRDDTSGRPMNFTVQCVLMINMFNEKLYIILWFWLAILTALNIVNLFYWLFITLVKPINNYYIQAQLNFAEENYKEDEIPSFIKYWISMDGLTALRLISANCGDLTSSDIVASMFHQYKDEKLKHPEQFEKKKKNNNDKPRKSFANLPPPKKGGNILENVSYSNNSGPQKVHPAPPSSAQQIPHAPVEESEPTKVKNVGSSAPKGYPPASSGSAFYPGLPDDDDFTINPFPQAPPLMKKDDVISVD